MAFRPNWYEDPPRRRGAWRRQVESWSGLKTVLVVTGVVYLAQMVVLAFGGIGAIGELNYWLGLRSWSSGGSINLLFPVQLFTYPLLHAIGDPGDYWHIVGNMFFLWIYGQFIEPGMGKSQFLRLYVGGAVVGGLAQWALGLATVSATPTVGASAAVYAVMAMAAFRHPHQKLLLLIPPMPVPIWVLFGVRIFFDVLSLLGGGPTNVALAAHLGGAAYGWLWHKRGDVVGQVVEKRKRDKAMAAFAAEADDRREMDRILAKIQATGLASLSTDERAFLERRSRELRKDHP